VALEDRLKAAATSWDGHKFGTVTQTCGIRLPSSLKVARPADDAILDLCDKYYDPALDERLESTLPSQELTPPSWGMPVAHCHSSSTTTLPITRCR
jgi:hypothetical protein